MTEHVPKWHDLYAEYVSEFCRDLSAMQRGWKRVEWLTGRLCIFNPDDPGLEEIVKAAGVLKRATVKGEGASSLTGDNSDPSLILTMHASAQGMNELVVLVLGAAEHLEGTVTKVMDLTPPKSLSRKKKRNYPHMVRRPPAI